MPETETTLPTPELRYVARVMDGYPTHRETVLQQAWRQTDGSIEWRDVPTVFVP